MKFLLLVVLALSACSKQRVPQRDVKSRGATPWCTSLLVGPRTKPKVYNLCARNLQECDEVRGAVATYGSRAGIRGVSACKFMTTSGVTP